MLVAAGAVLHPKNIAVDSFEQVELIVSGPLGKWGFYLFGIGVSIAWLGAALELSLDRDWFRLKLTGFYASGDSNPTDHVAKGFDSIQDNPLLIGGPFSWYTHEGFNLDSPMGRQALEGMKPGWPKVLAKLAAVLELD